MASKTKVRQITIVDDSGRFKTMLKRFSSSKKDYDFEGLTALRRLLSNEKARVLNVIKNKKPKSIYDLAKILQRDFKSVRDDLTLLSRFGFIDFVSEREGNRSRLRPVLAVDSINIEIKI
ncbi:hypothetical protein COU62_03455 [Candidatus Pacearchaeota archaeon CG10_big_fil_rev_8_21_14_0_10_35_219]|nr:hypothetical protein [Candidatus Pacearchaeota archaeon]OIO42354.1 MAG: hypothetical protein AUJ63_03715 [Candidatus Pacearchaeota archaeon CG1_02_35_32]PIO07409.1 MAG: hypothetical protein COU62_03455 [Candidatus Pacearchaeota archaeon CG10_big_fil_rev_8_21_14_0_10_35_219]PIZ80145.1 MAG: hypothetical protein COY00_01600 [Candidatus Pacearchaeota archaeon CG_4_10_14_0_2_um_filter_35_33]PJA69591.1 MAG: hypothetical protein CO155_04950 [Candidatus Pacearchaeota archaeon CG_4_9_14_3_um_filter_3